MGGMPAEVLVPLGFSEYWDDDMGFCWSRENVTVYFDGGEWRLNDGCVELTLNKYAQNNHILKTVSVLTDDDRLKDFILANVY